MEQLAVFVVLVPLWLSIAHLELEVHYLFL